MKRLPLLLVLLLAGCSFAEPEGKLTKTGVSDEQRLADFEGCKEQARAVIARDQTIDQGIAAGSTTSSIGSDVGVDADLKESMAAYRSGQRYDWLVERCMRNLGYVSGDD